MNVIPLVSVRCCMRADIDQLVDIRVTGDSDLILDVDS